MKKNVLIDLASGWRQLSEEERRALGAFADDEKIRLIAIATGSWVPMSRTWLSPMGMSSSKKMMNISSRIALSA